MTHYRNKNIKASKINFFLRMVLIYLGSVHYLWPKKFRVRKWEHGHESLKGVAWETKVFLA